MSDAAPNPNAIKQGDSDPLVATLSDANGPVNLSGAAVELRMVSKVTGAGHAPITGACTILQSVDANGRITNKGKVQYAWGPGETDIVGVYGLDFLVTWANGKTRSFPNDRAVTFEIEAAA